jgi:hypothetical protein
MKLEVMSIVEETSGSAAWDSADLSKKTFRPYSVRVELTASFDEAKNLVRALQDSNRLLNVVVVGINSDSRTPEKHQFTMTLEWPTWRDLKQAAKPFEAPAVPKSEKRDE